MTEAALAASPAPEPISIFLGTPAYNGVSCRYLESVLDTAIVLRDMGVRLVVGTVPGVSLVNEARDLIGDAFLSSGCTFLMMVDNDIGWRPELVVHMLQRLVHDPDAHFLIAAPPLRTYDLDAAIEYARAHPEDAEAARMAKKFAVRLCDDDLATGRLRIDRAGFAQIKHGGLAVSMMRRTVFERIAETTPHLACTLRNERLGHAYFMPEIFDGLLCGEDISFCRRWAKTGGKFLLRIDAALTHDGPHCFYGNLADLALGPKRDAPLVTADAAPSPTPDAAA